MLSKTKILIIIIVVIVVFGITQFFFYFNDYIYKVKEIQTVEMKVKVSDHVGFNLANDSLNFGMLRAGDWGSRNLSLSSDEEVRVKVILLGKVGEWATVKENDFVFSGKKQLAFIRIRNMKLEVAINEIFYRHC